MTPVELSRTVLHAVHRAVDGGELDAAVPERVVVTEPGPGGCGDFATNVALRLAGPAGQPPLRVAEILRSFLVEAEGIQDVVVTGPGFLNISLSERDDLAAGVVREIRERGAGYGHGDALAGEVVVLRVPYEVRAEVVADAVARIVATQGGRVEIEHGEPVNLRPVPAPEDPAPLGADAAQWALLHPAAHDRPRISADHLVQREGNPLFRVRYAHARTRALTRSAARLGFAAEPGDLCLGPEPGDLRLGPEPGDLYLGPDPVDPVAHEDPDAPVDAPQPSTPHPTAAHRSPLPPTPATTLTPLLTTLTAHPRTLVAAATHRAPDRLARHLVTLADAVMPLLPCVLPCGEEKPSAAHRARLALAEAAGTVLAGGLSLLGIDAPEHL
ncbi:ArgS-related anticodon-binding protein NrtL [Streptomyces sp. NPDC048297]|uniref:ArgS-related anticodon-binding protein NrtL n=1 Tax=Streptomyces sp. NPDC048297 TaxID=3365531 RepID=UPI0037228CBD